VEVTAYTIRTIYIA